MGFFEEFHRRVSVDIFNCANWLRIAVNTLKKSVLKAIASSILNSDDSINLDEKLYRLSACRISLTW